MMLYMKVIGADGASAGLWPDLSQTELDLLQSSAHVLKQTMVELG